MEVAANTPIPAYIQNDLKAGNICEWEHNGYTVKA